jgi:hypothetical protein
MFVGLMLFFVAVGKRSKSNAIRYKQTAMMQKKQELLRSSSIYVQLVVKGTVTRGSTVIIITGAALINQSDEGSGRRMRFVK